ncbi:MAG: sortase [Bacilli bacterium]|nr:sortase [Bacilli bacterium]
MRKKAKKGKKKIIFLLIGIPILLIIVLLIILGLLNSPKEDYYKIKPRTDKAEGEYNGETYSYKKVGWIQIQGTSIDLPVLYSFDVRYPVELEGYAHMTKYYPGFHNHMEVGGHNIFNLSAHPKIESEDFVRFEALMAFVYYDFVKENKYIQLTYGGKEYLYKIFMVGFIPDTTAYRLPFDIDYTEDQMKEFLEKIENHNIYNFNIDVSTKDSVLVLNTCTRFFGQDSDQSFYVVGRLVRDNEKINNYSVSKNKNYKEVEKILKGSEENEDM